MRHSTYYAHVLKTHIQRYLQKFGLKIDDEVNDGHKHIDLSIDSAKLDIEVDGVQHLTDPDQIITDIKRSTHSREDGYETIRVHNMDLKNNVTVEKIAKAVADVAEKRTEDIDRMAGIN